jgi:hyperosmotically inducible protein
MITTGVIDITGVKDFTRVEHITRVKDITKAKTVTGAKDMRTMTDTKDMTGVAGTKDSTRWALEDRLLYHRSTSALNTKVETKDGAVTLSGKAKNAFKKDLVTKFVRDVHGVKSVNNQMTIE